MPVTAVPYAAKQLDAQRTGCWVRLLSPSDVRGAIEAIAAEVTRRHSDLSKALVIGIHRGGVHIADLLRNELAACIGETVPGGVIDVTGHRDDTRSAPLEVRRSFTRLPIQIDGMAVLLVDDVISTGRTARAGLSVLSSLGRPRSVELVALIDRGHRELPIRPDYVGKHLPTSSYALVAVYPEGVFLHDSIEPS